MVAMNVACEYCKRSFPEWMRTDTIPAVMATDIDGHPYIAEAERSVVVATGQPEPHVCDWPVRCRCTRLVRVIRMNSDNYTPEEQAIIMSGIARCAECAAHIQKVPLVCGSCGSEFGTIEVDDRNPPTPQALSASRCGECSE